MRQIGRLFLFLGQGYTRLKCKLFSILVSGAFAHFGRRTMLMCPVRLAGTGRISIGDDVFIGPGSWLQSLPVEDKKCIAISIGKGTSIAGACVISAVRRVVLEEEVLLARNVYISDHMHKFTESNVPILAQGVDKISAVLIKRGAWLGQNVVVCPGVTVGEGSVVGANSVVTQDVPDFSVAVGAPARVVKNSSPLAS
jgi:acetyltransferase-like isoleucine patch superfamily enzyme